MKLFTRRNFKKKFFEYGTKLLLLAVTGLFCLWMISGARADALQLTDIKAQASNEGDNRIVLKFSSPLRNDQINVEFQRNFIQLSLDGVSAFPAKNQNVKSEVLEKVFTYQYKPDQARARILLKSDASKVKAQTTWKIDGNTIVVEIANGSATVDTISTKASGIAKRKSSSNEKKSVITEENSLGSLNLNAAEEDKIVKEIISGTSSSTVAKQNAPAAPVIAKEEPKKNTGSSVLGINSVGDEPLFAHSKMNEKLVSETKEKSANPIQKMLTGLLTVIAIMGAVAFGFKKFAAGRGLQFGGFGSRQNRVIDVTATHILGAKKSIALVRVADQYLVLGITGENINLLTNLGSDAKVEKYLDENHFGGSFDGALQKKMNASAADDFDAPLAAPAPQASFGIRDSIKRRLTGFKPL